MENTFEGKTVEEAKANACKALGVSMDDLFYQVVENEKKGFLGIGSKPAVIKVMNMDNTESFISNYLKDLFFKMGVTDYEESVEISENVVNVNLSGEELNFYTQKNTDIVESLQFLLAVTVNKVFDGNYKISLNINDYKEKSKARLENLAAKTAKQVLRLKKKVTLNAMTSYQRRIIHAALHDVENITTFSVGTEPNRKVVIAYDGPDKPFVKKDESSASRKKSDGNDSRRRGGGKPFDPSGLEKSSQQKRRNGNNNRKSSAPNGGERVEKVKILYPGPGSDDNTDNSNFNA